MGDWAATKRKKVTAVRILHFLFPFSSFCCHPQGLRFRNDVNSITRRKAKSNSANKPILPFPGHQKALTLSTISPAAAPHCIHTREMSLQISEMSVYGHAFHLLLSRLRAKFAFRPRAVWVTAQVRSKKMGAVQRTKRDG